MVRKILRRSRHFRLNWINSPDDPEKIRYYFNIVDDKFREEKIKRILDEIQNQTIINFSFEEIQTLEGRVAGSDLRYLCKVYDANCSPKLVSVAIQKIFKSSVIKDSNLYDRVKPGTSLEQYLTKIYED